MSLVAAMLCLSSTVATATDFDYDGDGKADIAVRRASSQYWYIRNSSDNNFNSEQQDGIQRVPFGLQPTDIPVVADYDGDSIADIAVRRPDNFTWYIRNSSGSNFNSERNDGIQRVAFGLNSTDTPVPADYDGDGKADVAVRRSSNFTWYIRNSSGSNFNSDNGDGIQRVVFGLNADDIPVRGDFNGDGMDDIAVRRPSNFTWYIRNSDGSNYNSDAQDGIQRVVFGRDTQDIPVPADYDGDGITDIAVRRPANFTWYILKSSDGEIQRITFGRDSDDIPVPADYDGDGKADVAVRRPDNQFFYVRNSSDDAIQRINFGLQSDDIPVNAPLPEVITKLGQVNGNNVATQPDFYSPQPIINVLGNERDVTWSELTENVDDLVRFAFGPGNSTDLFILNDNDQQVQSGLQLAAGLAETTTVSYENLLNSMFKFIALGDGSYRIVSTKHSNYVLDLDSNSDAVILRDYRSGERDDNHAGYLAFSPGSADKLTLQATGRWQYDSGTQSFVADSQWQSRHLIVTDEGLQLSTGEGSEFNIYAAPIDFTIPFDLNPEQIARVSNPEVTPFVKNGDLSGTATNINSQYAPQVSEQGNSAETGAAALAMLQEIETTLQTEGSNLRYPVDFYVTARNGLLERIYVSSDSTDGVIGQHTVPYVYFTNEADDDGIHHPFMVIASYNLPDSLTLLWDVPRPPGDGLGRSYDEEAVTRSIHKELLLMKIPLRDYGEVQSLTENNMENDLATDVGETNYDHHNYASTSSTGVAMDGVLIYPSYNNRLHISQSEAELSAHGMHSGRGLGAHYHADAFSANAKGLNLYNAEDYTDHSHPPIISLGFDGVAGYGIYLNGEGDGVDVALDAFGGHEHGDYGYHYHSWPEAETTDAMGIGYTAHQLAPLGAWSGRINDIPEFWSGTKPNVTGGRSKWLGNE